ncbi:MAG: hypothetical protein H2049_11005, partial [Porphyrobacter sp.]|nr:hypothetical protein [Porphyrobacter sp.]
FAAFAAWRSGPGAAAARAGVIMLGVVLAHSLVDYPLRTAGLALLAAAAAVIAARRDTTKPAPDAEPSEAPADDLRQLRITL